MAALSLGAEDEEERLRIRTEKEEETAVFRFECDAIKGEILGWSGMTRSCCWSEANEQSAFPKKPLDKLGIFCGPSFYHSDWLCRSP